MAEAPMLLAAASVLAGIAAASLVCAAFFRLLWPALPTGGRSVAAVLKQAGTDVPASATRSARRAQAIALKLVAEERRMKSMTRLSQKIGQAGLSWPAWGYAAVAATVGAAVLAAALLLGFPLGPSLSAALLMAVVIPSKALDTIIRRRQQQFLAGFAGAVDMIVRSARSGLSLPECLGMVASDAAPAIRLEFAPLVAQLRAGAPLGAVIEKLAARMPIPEVRFFVIVLSIQSQTGGNFTEALANLAGVLRERERLAAKVRTASAEVKASAITIGALPFVVAGATALLAPDYIAVLWQEDTGRRLMGLCIIWLIAGIAVLRRMARIEP